MLTSQVLHKACFRQICRQLLYLSFLSSKQENFALKLLKNSLAKEEYELTTIDKIAAEFVALKIMVEYAHQTDAMTKAMKCFESMDTMAAAISFDGLNSRLVNIQSNYETDSH